MKTIASGLGFPEGPVVLSDGTAYVAELFRGVITRISPEGEKTELANPQGGPNGMALGPDGCLYVCNSGGHLWSESEGGPGPRRPFYTIGRIERVDPETGEIRRLYEHCEGRPLSGPNDLVFDKAGGFYFTDIGKATPTHRVHGALYYGLPNGSKIVEVAFPMITPNGVGLSPDETVLYVAEMNPARIWAFDILEPSVVRKKLGHGNPAHGGRFVAGNATYKKYDSLAIDGEGNICVAALVSGAIDVITPDGVLLEAVPMPDISPTNICFSGKDMRTAYITLSGRGELVSLPWARPGLALNFSR